MNKKFFALKLIPSRPDFAQTMTDEERALMQEHAAYWRGYMNRGKVIVFGPVLDPSGVYGLGIVAVDEEQEVKEFIAGDPANKINSYEYYPILAVVPEK
ncbi:MAG: YciI family protein [Flavisolibacter sp.]